MKKTVLRALCAAIALILVVSLTGCGVVGALLAANADSSSSEAAPTPTPAPESAPTPEPASQSPDKGTADGMYATVREFMDDNRETLDASIRQMTEDQDDMEIVLDGTTDRLIYQFTFTESAMEGVDEEALTEVLEESLDDSSFVSTFQNIADSVKEEVAVDSVKVDVIYCRYDGKELAKKTFVSGSSQAAAAAPETSGVTMRGYLEAHRDELNEALAGEVENSNEISSLVLDATDDTLIYKATFDEAAIAGIPDSQLTDALYETLDGEMEDYFNALAVMIRTESGVSSAKIMVSYLKPDGTVLASREYAGK